MNRQPTRGAALLTAMIIVTLVASLAAGMVWQQYRAVQIEAADRARAQSGWILQGALDWARLILRVDAEGNARKPVDHLGEPWAVPLAEARLSTFLAADRSVASDDDGPEAFLSGNIEDAQARYNLRNLAATEATAQARELRTLERLCQMVNAPSGTAALIANGMRAAFPAAAASGATTEANPDTPLQPAGIDELGWLGVPADVIERLKPFVVLLPAAGTPVNLNTAPREVIAALFDGLDLASAERLVQARKTQPFQALGDAKNYLPAEVTLDSNRASVASSFFIVTGRLRLDERQLEQRSLIQRQNLVMKVLARERVSQILDTPR